MTNFRRTRSGRWIFLVAIGSGCGHHRSVVPVEFGAEWQSFRWVTAIVGGTAIPRAAMVVAPTDPTLAGGRGTGPVTLQLDFGFSSTGAFGLPLRLMDTTGPAAATPGELAGRIPRLAVRDDSSGTGAGFRLGTVGLLYYAVSGLLIDQVNQRLGAPLRNQRIPAELERRMLWSEAKEEVGRLALPLTADRDRMGRVWYDPASSVVPVLLTAEVWRAVTRRRGDEPDLERRRYPTTGDTLVLVGARPAAPLALGDIPLAGPVFFVAAGPAAAWAEALGDGVVGLVGNQAFASYRLVYLSPGVKRLGVAR